LIRFIFIGCIFVLSMSSCQKGVLSSAHWKLAHQRWITGDDKSMKIIAPDTTQAYMMDIRIEHTESYAFQNLYIRLLTTFPSGKQVQSVTSLELTNPDGSWAGKCGGKMCSVTLPLQPGFTFPEIGEYKLTIQPYMRLDTLDGLKRMTVTCRKRVK
jgi:gliding motility-associated lipoprotein GldH